MITNQEALIKNLEHLSNWMVEELRLVSAASGGVGPEAERINEIIAQHLDISDALMTFHRVSESYGWGFV